MTLAALATSTDTIARSSSAAVRIWLILVAGLLLILIAVGGATRITGSGLSITEWKPIMGAVPPLSAADWSDAFEKYKQIPQYKLVNAGMSLGEFKTIFWWEWGHRFLARVLGLAFALPLAWFWWRGALGGRLGSHLLGILALGGLQGAIGWYMVSSGLTQGVSVSPYRLAMHLGLAIAIFGLLVWTILDLDHRGPRSTVANTTTAGQRRLAITLLVLVFVQILLGAFVAGLRAGLTYNTWPLMDGKLIPNGLWTQSPWYSNLFENITTTQFNHRMMAYAILAIAVAHAWSLVRGTSNGPAPRSAVFLMLAILVQAALGIWTLLAVVPLSLGVLHQGGAVIVLGCAVWHVHAAARHP